MIRRNPSRRVGWKLLVLAAAVGGCTSATAVDRDFLNQVNDAEQLWRQAGPPATYSMIVRRVSVSDPLPRPIRLQVSGGRIEAATYADVGDPVPQSVRDQQRTVEGLFQYSRDLIGRRPAALEFEFHRQYGYPTEIKVDFDRTRFDDDFQILVNDVVF
jgi:hypothetical protein